MTIVVFGNKKGGCGKSITAVNLAGAAAHRGKSVCIVDTDTNETCNSYIRRRNLTNEELVEKGLEPYSYIKSEVKKPDDTIALDLQQLEKSYDLVIVDTGGYENRAFKTSIQVADVVYLPFNPCRSDMEQLLPTVKVIKETEEYIRDIRPDYSIDARLLIALTDHNSIDLIKEAKQITKPLLTWCGMSNVVVQTVKKVKTIQDDGLTLSDIKHPKRAMYELLLAELLGERNLASNREG